MERTFFEHIGRIKKVKNKLEKELNIKISIGKEVLFSGKEEDEFIAERVLDAVAFGFPADEALALKDEDFIFEKIFIPAKSGKRKEEIKGRLIGKHGRVREVLEHLSESFIRVEDNCVGIIAAAEDMKCVMQAVENMIKGSKHSNVYSFLEGHRARKKLPYDMGLKLKEKP
ncbi:hypothetical protein COV15_00440 [Candidatus Woesearchaeota archaeon CG10_big_fil_rev_8_21_14_0_10_34_12]|nr:MAG: hypothetical protein COV15_00440 [Candidatus Woesearchaeota archaeon CG10_big_fil_rev_8_21_14_0_10_34_12]